MEPVYHIPITYANVNSLAKVNIIHSHQHFYLLLTLMSRFLSESIGTVAPDDFLDLTGNTDIYRE